MNGERGVPWDGPPFGLEEWAIVRPFMPIQPNDGAFKVDISQRATNACRLFEVQDIGEKGVQRMRFSFECSHWNGRERDTCGDEYTPKVRGRVKFL